MKVNIQTKGLSVNEAFKDQIERRMYFAFGRFSSAIKSVDVMLRDDNGPKGGVDKSCRILVKLHAPQDVIVEGRGQRSDPLVDRTADRAARAVSRALHARHRKPTVRTDGNPAGRRA